MNNPIVNPVWNFNFHSVDLVGGRAAKHLVALDKREGCGGEDRLGVDDADAVCTGRGTQDEPS